MTFKYKAKNDIMKLCQLIVQKYMHQKNGAFYADYAEETENEFTYAGDGKYFYESKITCDQCGDSEEEIFVALKCDWKSDSCIWSVYEREVANFKVDWEDLKYAGKQQAEGK